MVIAWEGWAQCPVHQAHDQNFCIRRTCLTLEESARESSGCCVFLSVVYCQWQKVDIFSNVMCRNCSCQQHSVAALYDDRTVRLLGKLAGFNVDLAPVAEIDGLVVYRVIHLSCKIILRHLTPLGADAKKRRRQWCKTYCLPRL